MSPAVFRAFLDRFYRLASEAILGQDRVVDKFVGDEAIGLFLAGTTGPRHAAAAVRAARALLAMVGRPDATIEGAIPVGAAVHTGEAFVGSTGSTDAVTDFTALGDDVNTTARLASEAGAGELLVIAQRREARSARRKDVVAQPSSRAGRRTSSWRCDGSSLTGGSSGRRDPSRD